MANKCYFDDHGNCDYSDDLWQCQTCKEWFCHYHWHETDRGRNVECVACEYNRQTYGDDSQDSLVTCPHTEQPCNQPFIGNCDDCPLSEDQSDCYWSVQIPSEIRPGTWWDWGWFDTPGEAIEALREAGIPVDDHGNLQLLQEEG